MTVETETEDADEIRRLIKPQDHEFTANFNYDNGLDAWLACDSVVKQHDGSYETETEALGETWDVTLYYQDSSILPPRDGTTPNGTKIEHDQIREFRIRVEAQDELGEKKANYHIRPRWRRMRVETDEGDQHELSIPRTLVNEHDAMNVRVSGSNIDFCDYGDLLMCAASSLGVSAHHFRESYRHETSNVQDAAKYVRVHEDVSGPVHARTGPLVSLAHVLENDREGYRKLVQNDTNERGRQLAGYYHTATLGPQRVREVFPDHALPVECKHYYAREAHSRPDSDALAHPKVEVAYQTSRTDDTLHLTDENLAQLDEELTEWLYAILADAGLDLRANENVYVEDEYFSVENATTTASVVDLDLTEVRHEQESVVYKHLADGMAPTDQECLNVLVSDGGAVSPQDLAESTGRHEDTVYNSLARMNDLVTHTYGEVSLKSTYTSELVADALDQAQQAVDNAAKTAADAVHASKRGLDNATSAFVAWCERYGVNYNDNGDGMIIDLGRVDSIKEVRNILRSGFDRWCKMKRDAITFKSAKVKWEHEDDGKDLNYLPSSPTVRSHSQRAFTLLK
ncbi:DUF7845 domain-containing protein [Haloquadratum walsbyi]|uniref:Homolog to HGPV1-ORF14 n=1 Tax=Haloquadratum walsbyi (strain DSM 16854 / JCM 12705 / C23) TaxID=768065 RepID=G0LNG1_HALWC|nr:hypothetical protein [Haloquadratum walsbyi]CCC41967.1 homolog to HGPV1-ORF14 [Haloquadratum walsbyi C23]